MTARTKRGRTYKCIICGAQRDETKVVFSKAWGGKWVCDEKYINDCNVK